MKHILLLMAVLGGASAYAQDYAINRNNKGQVEFSEVVTADSISSTRLYENARTFLSNVFHGARRFAQILDDKTKTVATKGSFPVTIENARGESLDAKVYFTFYVQSKDGVYRYNINEIYFAFTEETGITSYASFNDRLGVAMTSKQWLRVEEQTIKFVTAFVDELKRQMRENDNGSKEALSQRKRKGERQQ